MTLRFGQKRSFEAGSPIEISDGQLMERADFALPKRRRHHGTHLRRVRRPGRQRARAGAALSDGAGAAPAEPRRRRRSDGRHRRLSHLWPRARRLLCQRHASRRQRSIPRRQNNDTTSYASTYYPGTGNVAEAQRLTLGVGQEQPNVNFALQPVRTVKITGTALNSHGHRAFKRNGHADGGRGRRWTRRWWSGTLRFRRRQRPRASRRQLLDRERLARQLHADGGRRPGRRTRRVVVSRFASAGLAARASTISRWRRAAHRRQRGRDRTHACDLEGRKPQRQRRRSRRVGCQAEHEPDSDHRASGDGRRFRGRLATGRRASKPTARSSSPA